MTTDLLSATPATLSAARPAAPAASPTPPRLDLYAAIHKALRLVMSDSLARVGSLDADDPAARAEVVAQLRRLCAMCRAHVAKENHHVHPVVEACRQGGSARIAAEHEEHLVAIDALEAAAVVFEAAPSPALAHRLYRQLAGFVAENLAHMEVEESVHNALLWAARTDAELVAIHEGILAAIGPEEMAEVLHWMLPALSPAERAGMLADMRAKAPAPAFEGVLQLAQARLPRGDWLKLVAALERG